VSGVGPQEEELEIRTWVRAVSSPLISYSICKGKLSPTHLWLTQCVIRREGKVHSWLSFTI
jgi:hypothetical protein